jgi:predicted CXXCH cytochrome family protein
MHVGWRLTKMARTRMRSILNGLFIFTLALPTWAVEHPGVLPKDVECSSCHIKQISGKSVHSAMATSCTVCHVAKTQGDMTALNLAMPKEKICFACHERSAALKQHVPVVKGTCVDCHDSHSSGRRMLLLEARGTGLSGQGK